MSELKERKMMCPDVNCKGYTDTVKVIQWSDDAKEFKCDYCGKVLVEEPKPIKANIGFVFK